MKKLYTALFALAISFASFGQQCSPNPPRNTPGIYAPAGSSFKNDTIYVLPSVNYNRSYNQTIQIVVPADTTITYGTATVTADIDSMRVLSVNNTPSWLNYGCDNGTCTWDGGTAGCLNFAGTSPSSASTTLMEAEIEAFANLGTFGTYRDTFFVYIEVNVDANVGFAENQTSEPVVGPNPTSGNVNVSFEAATVANWKFELLDITGRVVTTKRGMTAVGMNSIQIERNNWPEGMYLYRFTTNGKVHTGRLIVQDGI